MLSEKMISLKDNYLGKKIYLVYCIIHISRGFNLILQLSNIVFYISSDCKKHADVMKDSSSFLKISSFLESVPKR